jgi:hypothetical protein
MCKGAQNCINLKIRGTALVTLNKVGGNPVSYSTANPRWKGVNVCLERETIDSVIPRIFLILSIGTAYGSIAAAGKLKSMLRLSEIEH